MELEKITSDDNMVNVVASTTETHIDKVGINVIRLLWFSWQLIQENTTVVICLAKELFI